MLFSWHGVDSQGFKVQGKDKAADVRVLTAHLQSQKICVLGVKKISPPMKPFLKISSRKITEFTRQLAVLCDANIDLIQAFSLLIQQEKNLKFKKLIEALKNEIENGASLSDAFNHFPDQFDKIYCGILQSGEQSGALGVMLMHLAHYQENMLELKTKIIKALFYPLTLVSTATLITLGLLLYVVPQFKTIFNGFGAQLPKFTLFIIGMAQILQKQIIIFLAVMLAVIFVYHYFLKKSAGFHHWRDKIKLHLPFFNHFIINSNFARWTRIMCTLLTAQLSLIHSLQITNQTFANLTLQSEMQKIINRIKEGDAFHQALAHHPYFPKQLISFLSVGESTGRLPQMLQRMAQVQQSRLDSQIDYFSKWLEPAAMLILAVMVGSLIIGMYLPIFQLGAIL